MGQPSFEEVVQSFDFSKVNLLIGLPCYGGMTHVAHNRSMRQLEKMLAQYRIRHTISETTTESLIPRGRNSIANLCLFEKDEAGEEYTHLLFLDVDIGFHPYNIIQAIAWNRDITALPYPAKVINWNYVVAAVKRGVEDSTTLSRMGSRPIVNTNEQLIPFNPMLPVEFPQLGTGILLIKRNVLERFARDEKRKFRLMQGEKFSDREFGIDFFQIGINAETKYYDSEDYRFCLDARAMGFETWLLPFAVTSHTGPMDFWMDMAAQAQYGIPEPDFLPKTSGFVPLTI